MTYIQFIDAPNPNVEASDSRRIDSFTIEIDKKNILAKAIANGIPIKHGITHTHIEFPSIPWNQFIEKIEISIPQDEANGSVIVKSRRIPQPRIGRSREVIMIGTEEKLEFQVSPKGVLESFQYDKYDYDAGLVSANPTIITLLDANTLSVFEKGQFSSSSDFALVRSPLMFACTNMNGILDFHFV